VSCVYNDHMTLHTINKTLLALDNFRNYTNYMDSDAVEHDLTFAVALARLRKWKSITQQELADDINVSKTTVSSYESLILNRIPPKALIDTLVDYFKDELEVLKFDLYRLAGLYNVMGQAKQSTIESELKEIKKNIMDLRDTMESIQKSLESDIEDNR